MKIYLLIFILLSIIVEMSIEEPMHKKKRYRQNHHKETKITEYLNNDNTIGEKDEEFSLVEEENDIDIMKSFKDKLNVPKRGKKYQITFLQDTNEKNQRKSLFDKYKSLISQGRCGDFDGKSIFCPNQCCSRYGYCGITKEYCNEGCQPEFGLCAEDFKEKEKLN
ncbi:hypothetical protein LY90DRAFT_668351 [Neocallimastix californiae]|uniref:Chitin-binding type-1 domain-containing protein n=1 Tax=Neocallimastix californiae TaxID=1754190 RepID=A0A1Y2DUJ8_9FUNG|nr:hypothetical protein LY90DRAFT_668351 [Neocallimastix californiae]|eukprot:ORY62814.1 hypothetical protein LY90DRAFT_668351 [Neocallimastix californiae]